MPVRVDLNTLLQALRHAAIGLAVVAVLISAFGIHEHALAAGTAQDCCLADLPENPADPEPDAEGHCHCPPSAATTPDATTLDLSSGVAAMARTRHGSVAPDSLNFPPDPPPVRLG